MSECLNHELNNSVLEVKDNIQNKQKNLAKISGQMDKVLIKDVDLVTMLIGKEKQKNQEKTPFKSVDQNK